MSTSMNCKAVQGNDDGTSSNEMNNDKAKSGIKPTSFYGNNEKSIRIKQLTSLHLHSKTETEPSKKKSTTKKNRKSISQKKVRKTDLFPGIKIAFKKRSAAKNSLKKTECGKEKKNLTPVKVNKTQLKVSTPLKKKVWEDFIKQEKPKRIQIERPENRKFFKSQIINNFSPNKKYDSLNLKIVNWDGKNRMSTIVKGDETDSNGAGIHQSTTQHLNEVIESSDVDKPDSGHTSRYPGLLLRQMKSNENESSEIKSDVLKNEHVGNSNENKDGDFISNMSSKKPTLRRSKRLLGIDQYQIDARQKKFDGSMCQFK